MQISNPIYSDDYSQAFAIRIFIQFILDHFSHNLVPDGPALMDCGHTVKTPVESGSRVSVEHYDMLVF